MQLEKQVSSLELSQRLKELNVNQESLFCWCGKGEHIKIMLNSIYDAECNPNLKICSAFTVAELGESIKPINKIESEKNYFTYWDGELWIAWETEYGLYESGKYITALTEADARAKMLIYLIENGLLKNDNLHPTQ